MNPTPEPPHPPRIPPVTDPTPEQAEILDKTRINDGPPANVFATMAHHTTLLKRFNVLGGAFMGRNVLSPRLRELSILRAAHASDCLYEFAQHRRIALDGGLLDADEIARVVTDARDGWPEQEQAVIDATDELTAHPYLTDATWRRLEAFLDRPQLIELTLLIGFYRGLAGMLNTVGVELDESLQGPEDSTWPSGRTR